MSVTQAISERYARKTKREYARRHTDEALPEPPEYVMIALKEQASRAYWQALGQAGIDEEMERNVKRWLRTKHMGTYRVNRILHGDP